MTMNSNPFLPSTHGHPNFNPTKSVTKNNQLESSRNTKQPKPPDKPLTPYMRYNKKIWEEVRAQYSELKAWEVSKIVGQMWRELNEDEKQKYVDEYEADKTEYNELLRQYHNSTAYQSWIASLKTKETDDRDVHKRRDRKNNNPSHNSPQKSEGRFTLQPFETDENEEYFSAKHLAAARYYRNNKLVNEIFSDTVIQETRSAYELKVQVLRKQVDSLTVYQKRLDEELKQLEEKFQQKKHALLEAGEQFQNEMNKRFAPNDLDMTLKDHYKKTLIKTMEMMKNNSESIDSRTTINRQPQQQLHNDMNHLQPSTSNGKLSGSLNINDNPINGIQINHHQQHQYHPHPQENLNQTHTNSAPSMMVEQQQTTYNHHHSSTIPN